MKELIYYNIASKYFQKHFDKIVFHFEYFHYFGAKLIVYKRYFFTHDHFCAKKCLSYILIIFSTPKMFVHGLLLFKLYYMTL